MAGLREQVSPEKCISIDLYNRFVAIKGKTEELTHDPIAGRRDDRTGQGAEIPGDRCIYSGTRRTGLS